MNRIVIAAAGSGKTTSLVDEAVTKASNNQRILILTYTRENHANIKAKFGSSICVPSKVTLMTWFAFLLHDCIRPYHNHLSKGSRVQTINFVNSRSSRFIRKSDTERYYFDSDRRIFTDKLSEFACEVQLKSRGLVVKRLEELYDHIYIDEFQDLAGYDLELIDLLLRSSISLTLVGDPRQVVYQTNPGGKNTKYKQDNIIQFFREREEVCNIEERSFCYRSNQAICDFADQLYPSLPSTNSLNREITGHDGIFIIKQAELGKYMENHTPVVLRYNVRTNTHGYAAINMGQAKGVTYDRVLIFPTNAMANFIERRDPKTLAPGTKAKLYVAVTRARYSATFVVG